MKKLFIGVALLCCLLVVVACEDDPKGELFTLDKFNAIEMGMTYEEVMDIVKVDGEVSSENSLGEGEYAVHTIAYTWIGSDVVKGTTGANVILMFQNGKLLQKNQVGLE